MKSDRTLFFRKSLDDIKKSHKGFKMAQISSIEQKNIIGWKLRDTLFREKRGWPKINQKGPKKSKLAESHGF